MFTGIVADTGRIRELRPSEGGGRRLVVEAPSVAAEVAVGDSVAVDGVCLTVVGADGETFAVDVVPETLARTTLGTRSVGEEVNLERPVAARGRFDGHLVQGHVDTTGRVLDIRRNGDAVVARFGLPGEYARYVAEKGSIAVDGVSLTVTAVEQPPVGEESWFEVALVPHTLAVTTLGTKPLGAPVNLEVDIIAKYVERWRSAIP